MTTHRTATRVHHRTRRAGVAAVATAALTAGAFASSPSASAATPPDVVPAAGSVVTCQTIGALTAVSGSFLQREPVRIDGRGRAHVLFTTIADRVVLVGSHGTRYRFVGGGYDHVIYPTTAIVGDVVTEDEQFRFDIIGPRGVAGVVRFSLHTGSDQIAHIHDTSTCQIPGI